MLPIIVTSTQLRAPEKAIYDKIVCYGRQWSFKVIKICTSRKPVCDFLLVFHCINCRPMPIFCCFRDITICWSTICIFHPFNPLDAKGNYSATSNNTKLVHWPVYQSLYCYMMIRCSAVCHAMRCISAAYVIMRCLSVCVSVTFVSCFKTNKRIFEIFSPSGSHTILVFPYQTGWRYSDANPPNGDVECRWGGQKSRF